MRVALLATAVMAMTLVVAAVVIDVVVMRNAVQSIDSRLQSRLDFITSGTDMGQGMPRRTPDQEQNSLNLPLALWVIDSDGSIFARTPNTPDLPDAARHVSGPTDVALGGVNFRISGEAIPGGRWVVIGQSRDVADRDMASLIVTELFVVPALCLLVLLGALVVGRQVGRPIEAARQRQLAFTADASHELRTPVAVIEAETSLALGKTRKPAEYRDTLQRIGHEGGRLRHIVDSLLWLARVDAKPDPPGAELTDIAALAHDSAERFTPVAAQKNIALTFGTAGEGSMLIVTPPEWADRLLGVLLDNACRYTPEGGRVHLSVIAESGRVTVAVDDSGPGIPAEDRARIFERFHRAAGGEEGAGLGLAIADIVVRSTHGSWIVGTSELGGAHLAVSWPSAR